MTFLRWARPFNNLKCYYLLIKLGSIKRKCHVFDVILTSCLEVGIKPLVCNVNLLFGQYDILGKQSTNQPRLVQYITWDQIGRFFALWATIQSIWQQ